MICCTICQVDCKTPIVLVGNKVDLRLSPPVDTDVSADEGRRTADDIGAAAYCECSAKTGAGVGEMFDRAVRLTLYDSRGQLKTDRSTNKVGARSKTKSRRRCVVQ